MLGVVRKSLMGINCPLWCVPLPEERPSVGAGVVHRIVRVGGAVPRLMASCPATRASWSSEAFTALEGAGAAAACVEREWALRAGSAAAADSTPGVYGAGACGSPLCRPCAFCGSDARVRSTFTPPKKKIVLCATAASSGHRTALARGVWLGLWRLFWQ